MSLKQKIFEYGVEPKRQRGQNFLIDENVLKKIVSRTHLSKKDTVVEIGAGLGFLTKLLAQKVKKVFAVEIDKGLFEILTKEVRECKNVTCIQDDARDISLQTFGKKNGSYSVVANIPYNITSQIIQKFLEGEPRPSQLFLLIQKEVAMRICAQVPDMNVLACAVQYSATPRILFHVSRSCFYPVPSVDSVVIYIDCADYARTQKESEQYFRCVRAGFARKRKFLISNLLHGLDISRKELEHIFTHSAISLTVRAQELSISQWIELSERLHTFPLYPSHKTR